RPVPGEFPRPRPGRARRRPVHRARARGDAAQAGSVDHLFHSFGCREGPRCRAGRAPGAAPRRARSDRRRADPEGRCPMPIPKYTHQQFAVLDALKEGELWGRDLRAALKADGYGSTNAAFYELMDRLERNGLVEGWYEERNVLGQLFKERKYKLAGLGQE